MIRRKKSIYLAVLALSAVSLSGCGEVSNNSEGYVLTSEYNGIKLDINTNDIIERYISENRNEHAAALYDALNEVVIRMAFEEGGVLADFKSTVEREATEAVNKKKDEIDEGDQTWDEFLEGEIPGDDLTTEQREQEFFLDQEYTAMKTTVDEQYFDRFSDYKRDANADDAALQDEYNLLYGTNGYIQKKVPYDIRHILIQVDASDDYGYSRGHISATNIEDMYRVFEALIGGNDFADVANSYTDDTGNDGDNGKNGGEYLMDNAESFVNEFKLGIYTYDLLINNQYIREGMSPADGAIYDEKYSNLHIPESAEEGLTDFGVTYIPYEVIQELYDVRNVTTANGVSVYDGNEDYLPRNIYFNKYFQNRNIAFVTNERMLTTEELIGEETVPSDWSSYNAEGNAMLTRKDAVSGETVFSDIDAPEVRSGNVHVALNVRKTAGIYELTFEIDGVVQVVCDRCLDDMDQPVSSVDILKVKLGDDYLEDGDMVIIPEDEGEINVAWYIYEFIALDIPIKHVHEAGKCNKAMEGKLNQYLRTLADDENQDEDESDDSVTRDKVDPRWNELKKIIDNN